MSFYGDIYKPVGDFFKKTFSYGHAVEISSKASNGVEFKHEGGVDDKKKGYGKFTGKYKEGALQCDKLEIATAGTIKGEFKAPDAFANTSVTFKFEDGSRSSEADTSAKFGVTTTQDLGVSTGVSLEVDAVAATAEASVLIAHEGFRLGAKAVVDTHMGSKDKKKGMEVTDYDLLGVWTQDGTTAGVQTGEKLSNVTAFLHNAFNDSFTVIGRSTFHIGKAKAAAGDDAAAAAAAKKKKMDITLDFGATYKLDESTTLHGAVDKDANVQFGYSQKVSDASTFNLYANIKAKNLSGDKHTLGTKLQLRA